MARESTSLGFLTAEDASAQLFRQARGTDRAEPIDLPWLDVDKAFLVAVNERPGDDVAVALDYRTDPADPRVVASDFWTEPGPCSWREVAPTFSALVAAFDLQRTDAGTHFPQHGAPCQRHVQVRADPARQPRSGERG
jgi:hypothetical protein